MRVGQEDKNIAVENETICREKCLNNCSCQAYSFVEGEVNRGRGPINMCLIWTDVLKDLQEDYPYGGPDLFVRVSKTDTGTSFFRLVLSPFVTTRCCNYVKNNFL